MSVAHCGDMDTPHRFPHQSPSATRRLHALADVRTPPEPPAAVPVPPAALGGRNAAALMRLSGVHRGDADIPVERRVRRTEPRLRFTSNHALLAMLLLVVVTCASLTLLIQQSANYAAAGHSNTGGGSSAITAEDSGDEVASGQTPTETGRTETERQEHVQPDASDGFIDLNEATSEQLQTINGIGPAIAGRILDYRTRIGRFTSVDQLLDVSGIGTKTLQKIREKVKV